MNTEIDNLTMAEILLEKGAGSARSTDSFLQITAIIGDGDVK